MRVMSDCYSTSGLPGLPRSSYRWDAMHKHILHATRQSG